MDKNKPVSIGDVAKLAGVSPGTVSNALNSVSYVKESTREKVLKAAKELNYVPNRAGRILKTNQTKLIMLAIPDVSNEIYFGMIEAVMETIQRDGYSLMLYYTNAMESEEHRAIQMLQERIVDGLILVHFSYSKKLLEEVKNTISPIVLISMCNHMWAGKDYPFDTISVDVYKGIRAVMEHLIQMGFYKIGYLAGRKDIEVYRQRYQAYMDVMKEQDIPVPNGYVQWSDFTQSGGYNSGRQLYMRSDRPDAICGSNDLQTIGCWEAIKDLGGRVPEDISLTGMDNIQITKVLEITSVIMCEREMGNGAASLLMQRLKDRNAEYRDLYYRPTLQVRDSSLKKKEKRV